MDNYLKVRRLQLGLTLKEIAAKVGVSEATVSRWESGQIANMKRQYIAAYAAALQTTPGFIMTGKEDDKEPQPTPIPPGFQPMPEMATVPIVGRITCGTPILAEQNIEGSACVPARWRATGGNCSKIPTSSWSNCFHFGNRSFCQRRQNAQKIRTGAYTDPLKTACCFCSSRPLYHKPIKRKPAGEVTPCQRKRKASGRTA